MLPKLIRIPLEGLTGELAWIILLISGVIAFLFYFFIGIEKKKSRDKKTTLLKIYNILYYFSIFVSLIMLYAIMTHQATLDFNSYGFMLAIAFVLGVFLIIKKARQENIPEEILMDLTLYGVLISMVGARLFYMLFEAPDFFDNPLSFFDISSGGLVVYGGFLFGFTYALSVIRYKKLPLGKVVDIYAPTLALGVGFARLGCNFAGCCWGKVCEYSNPIGIKMSLFKPSEADLTKYKDLINHVGKANDLVVPPVFDYYLRDVYLQKGLSLAEALKQVDIEYLWPAQLISSLNGFIMFAVLSYIYYKYKGRFKFDGFIFIVFLIYYSITRFIIEFIRIDTPKEYFGLSAAQFIGIFVLLFSIILMIYNLKQSNRHNIS